jgi:spore maturation protein CgeB
MTSIRYRILFEGERWFGSNADACASALRRLGHSVIEIDFKTWIPEAWNTLPLKACRRLLIPLCIKAYNQHLLQMARHFRPHILLAFKGKYLLPTTLHVLKDHGVALYNFYPDVSAFSHKYSTLPHSLAQYNCVFSTKTFLPRDLEAAGVRLRRYEILNHGYNPALHRPLILLPDEEDKYHREVVFIGTYSLHKEQILTELKKRLPNLDLAVWGNSWERARAPELKNCIQYQHLLGEEYVKGLAGAKIVLALLSERVPGASQGDQVTSRTFNIPATGAFMLHERNDEVLRYYEEGREIECFSTVEELADKVTFYLAHDDERQAIARAGYARCVPAYSVDERMRAIIAWHERSFSDHRGRPCR